MKKLIAIVMVVMVAVCSVAVGEVQTREDVADKMMDYAAEAMKMLLSAYRSNKEDGIKGDYLYVLYSYYDMYQAMYRVKMAEADLELALHPLSGGKSPILETRKKSESVAIETNEFIGAIWKGWIKGEQPDEMFEALVVTLVEETVKRHTPSGK